LSNGSVRALVLALDNVDAIPNGALLYSCDVRIAAEAQPGRYPVTVTETGASDPNGLALPFFFSSRRRHTRFSRDWSSDVCSSDLRAAMADGCLRLRLAFRI